MRSLVDVIGIIRLSVLRSISLGFLFASCSLMTAASTLVSVFLLLLVFGFLSFTLFVITFLFSLLLSFVIL